MRCRARYSMIFLLILVTVSLIAAAIVWLVSRREPGGRKDDHRLPKRCVAVRILPRAQYSASTQVLSKLSYHASAWRQPFHAGRGADRTGQICSRRVLEGRGFPDEPR